MRQFYVLLLIFLLYPAVAGASTQTFNFSVSNNTAINFENGSYIVEIIELYKPVYVKVNLTSGGASRINYLYDTGEGPITFNQIKLSASSITGSTAVIRIEFPDGWGYPSIYKISPPPVGTPNIVITRTVDKTTVNPGDVVSFIIKVENTGNATAQNITLTERLPNGFSVALGRFPPVMVEKLDAGESQELYYALKAVDPGTYNVEPTVVKYGSKTSKSNPATITVAAAVQEKSNLTAVISVDKNKAYTGDLIRVSVRITNTGKAPAKSVLVDGTPPQGLEVVEGDLRQVYESIASGEPKEYRVVLKAAEAGNYTIYLRAVYNDNQMGESSVSGPITVTRKEADYLVIIIPVTTFLAGFAIFTIKRYKEYRY